MKFKAWYEESTKTNNRVFTAQEFYEAGVASRQVEIDSLNKNIESLHIENERIQREYQMTFDNLRGRQQTIDALNASGEMSEKKIDDLVLRNIELQKQLNEVQKWAEWHIEDYCMGDNNSAHDRGWYNAACQLINLLRGGKND